MWGNNHGFYYEVCIAASPNGRDLAFTNQSGQRLVLADISSIKDDTLNIIASSTERIIAVDFSPDAKQLAFIDCRARVQVLDITSGNVVADYRVCQDVPGDGDCGAIRFSLCGHLLAASCVAQLRASRSVDK